MGSGVGRDMENDSTSVPQFCPFLSLSLIFDKHCSVEEGARSSTVHLSSPIKEPFGTVESLFFLDQVRF